MRVRIRHETRYRYAEPALAGRTRSACARPSNTRAKVLSYNLASRPRAADSAGSRTRGATASRGSTFPAGAKAEELALAVDAAFEIGR